MRMMRVWAVTALAMLAQGVFAAEVTVDQATVQRNAALAEEMAALQSVIAGRSVEPRGPVGRGALRADPPRSGIDFESLVPGVKSATPVANFYRAYAPSCLAYRLPEGLPLTSSGPVYPQSAPLRMRLAAIQVGNPNYVDEFVDIDIWRIACSSQNFYNSATLVRIKRDAANEGRTDRYPLFPGVRLTQGNATNRLVRIAEEPNTVVEHIEANKPFFLTTTYLLENFPSNSAITAEWDFNLPFAITFDNFFTANNRFGTISVPGYAPTSATYPNRGGPVQINGYLTGNWYDPAHSGEGMLVQVFDLPGDNNNLLFTFAWFTFSNDGRPFWLFGATTFPRDSRGPLSVPTVYQSGGGFAGNFGASAQSIPWGNLVFTFAHCRQMTFNFNSNVNIPGIPTGVGQRTWSRAVDTNGLTCDIKNP